MLEVCPSIAADKPRARSIRSSIGGATIPCDWCSRPRPARRVVVGLSDLGTRLRLVANEVDVGGARRGPAEAARGAARLAATARLATAAESWLLAGGPHHTCFSQAVGLEAIEDFAEIAGVELRHDRRATPRAANLRRELRWNQAYHHLAGGV